MQRPAAMLLLLLAGCQKMEETGPAAQPKPGPPPITAADLLIRRDTPNLRFLWRAPADLGEARALLQQMRNDALNAAQQMARDAADCAGGSAGPSCNYFRLEDWEVAANTPGLLAITTKASDYTGGAHPNAVWKAILWDKAAHRRIGLPDLFTDWPRAQGLLTGAYCTALDVEREARRGAPVSGDGPFDECPALAEHPAVPMQGPWTGIHAIRVLLSPYEAGPYVEGSYEIDVPVTDELRALMKASYLPKG